MLRSCLVMVCLWPSPELALAQPPPRPELVTAETEAAIQQSLEWLARQQDPQTGAFGTQPEFSRSVGLTALAGLAMLSSGSTPEAGPYRDELRQCTRYLLDRTAPNGFIIEDASQAQGPMYGHGFAVLYLAEVYGMSDQPELRQKLRRSVDLIIACQNDEGGWRYFPKPDEADISVTVCQVMALRAARNAGLSVPKEVIQKAVDYVRRCQNPDGGFRYRVNDAAESRLPRSAAAIVALYSSGVTEGPVVTDGLRYMQRYVPGPRTTRDPQYYFYAVYYSSLATWHAGEQDWKTWYPAQRDELLRLRHPNGHWTDPWIGNDYATAMALIALQLPYDYVPIFER